MGFDITGLGSVADFASTLVKRFLPEKMSEEEKAQKTLQLQGMLQQREDTVINAKRDIMVAEAQQGDNYTKRARPTLIYLGLLFIGLIHVLFPITIKTVLLVCVIFAPAKLTPEALAIIKSYMDVSLPVAFWTAWGGAVSIYSLGRSAEKRGVKNKLIGLITGNS